MVSIQTGIWLYENNDYSLVGSVMFTHHPSNKTVCEGDQVTFSCSYIGTLEQPCWRINEICYDWTRIPHPYIETISPGYRYNLRIESASLQYNEYTYQCRVLGFASSVGVLNVSKYRIRSQ